MFDEREGEDVDLTEENLEDLDADNTEDVAGGMRAREGSADATTNSCDCINKCM